MTFCAGPCADEDCPRQITDAVTDAANREGLPLSISDLRETCPDYCAPRSTPTADTAAPTKEECDG